MSKDWIKPVLLVALGVFTYLWISQPGDEKPDEKEVEKVVTTTTTLSTTTLPRKPPPTPPKSASVEFEPKPRSSPIALYKERKREDVDVKVVQGLAIAFGDVVVGRVERGKEGQLGRFAKLRPRLWEQKIIPFGFGENFQNKARVLEVIEYFNENTPIEFVPYEGEENALMFVPFENECASYLGMTGGHQAVFLSDKCGFREIAHELMHALGFIHEHSRPDRDSYVEVVWENIKEGFESQFSYAPDYLIEHYSGNVFSFDYASIMLYYPNSFAREKELVTLESTTSEQLPVSKKFLSQLDIDRLYAIYGHRR